MELWTAAEGHEVKRQKNERGGELPSIIIMYVRELRHIGYNLI